MGVASVVRKVNQLRNLQKIAPPRPRTSTDTLPPTLLARYRFDPARYVKDHFGWEPWQGTDEQPGQRELFDAYVLSLRKQHEKRDFENGLLSETDLVYYTPGETIKTRFRVEAGHTVGKCVVRWAMIPLANGARVPAETLIGQTFEMFTVGPDGTVIRCQTSATDNGVKPVYRITTESGYSLERTGNHPLWASKAIFSSGRRPKIDEGAWSPVSQLQIGDVVAVAETLPAFGTESPPDCEVKVLAYLIGDGGLTSPSTVFFAKSPGGVLDEFLSCIDMMGAKAKLYRTLDWNITGKNGRGGKRHNPVLELLKAHDLAGKRSRDKRVPKQVFGYCRRSLALFLNRLFSTDGWASIGKDNSAQIGYSSASEGMIDDIQHLLLRFGVHARKGSKVVAEKSYWHLSITDAADQLPFLEGIGIFGRETTRLEVEVRRICDRKQKQIALRPDRPRWQHKNAHPGTRWDRVKSVEYIGEVGTVAFEVPVHDTYLTEFWEHNTKSAAGLVNHFFDCFPPSIIYSYAPNFEQVKDLLWKEIRSDRLPANLPGRCLSLRLEGKAANHFATGKALNNQGGMGSERAQGQHGEYLMFVLDEAEGLPDFIYDAVDSMTSGGITITLMLANPKTRASRFYKVRTHSRVQNFRISCHNHPNVVAGREIIPQAVKRDYIEDMLEKGLKERGMAVVQEYNPDRHTFSLPYPVKVDETVYPPGTIFEPDREYLFRVMGIAPADAADNTLIPVGRYEAALARKHEDVDPAILEPHKARLGIDVARFGHDFGTGYTRHNGCVRRFAQFAQKNNIVYKATVKDELLRLHRLGVRDVEVRVDGGGGFGGGVVDLVRADLDLQRLFTRFVVYEVLFNGTPKDPTKYADPITEMTDKAGEALRYLRLEGVPDALLEDLTERPYDYALYKGVLEVKQLQSKKQFKKDHEGRSPDDGDGWTLATAPDYLFVRPPKKGNQSRQVSHSD